MGSPHPLTPSPNVGRRGTRIWLPLAQYSERGLGGEGRRLFAKLTCSQRHHHRFVSSFELVEILFLLLFQQLYLQGNENSYRLAIIRHQASKATAIDH